jgi:hypothetical protein
MFPLRGKALKYRERDYDPEIDAELGYEIGSVVYEPYYVDGVILDVIKLTDVKGDKAYAGKTTDENGKEVAEYHDVFTPVSGVYVIFAEYDENIYRLGVHDIANIRITDKTMIEYEKLMWNG